jgi:hypothetical protein
VSVEKDAAVFADDDDGAVDTVAFWSEGIVGAGDVETVVDEEIEGKVLLVDEREVAGGIGVIDAVRFGVEGPECVDRVAHGGELIRSARGAVSRVEEKADSALAALGGEIESPTSRA